MIERPGLGSFSLINVNVPLAPKLKCSLAGVQKTAVGAKSYHFPFVLAVFNRF